MEDKDQCGNVKQVVETITRDWVSNAFDIRAQTVNNVKKIMFIGRTTSAAGWDGENAVRTYGFFGVVYFSLGSIRPGQSYAEIKAIGTEYANGMGPYGYFTNNCDTFAQGLYARIA